MTRLRSCKLFGIVALMIGPCSSGGGDGVAPTDDEAAIGGEGGGHEEGGGPGGDGAGGGGSDVEDAAAQGGAMSGGAGGQAGGASTSAGGAGGTSADAGGMGGANMPAVEAPNKGCPEHSFCTSFEDTVDGAFKHPYLRVTGKTENFQVVSDRSNTGKKSVKVTLPAETQQGQLLLRDIPQLTGGGKSVFARMMIRFEPKLPKTERPGNDGKAPHWRLITMAEATNTTLTSASVSAGVVGANGGRLLYTRAQDDCSNDRGTLTGGEWVCVEMQANQTGHQAWFDSVAAGSANATASKCWEKPNFVRQVTFGFETAAAVLTEPTTFYLDDIVLSSKRIGCP